jgi:bacteriorhodopsin
MLARLSLWTAVVLSPALALAETAEESPGYGALAAVVVLLVIAVALYLSFKKRPPRQQSTPRT